MGALIFHAYACVLSNDDNAYCGWIESKADLHKRVLICPLLKLPQTKTDLTVLLRRRKDRVVWTQETTEETLPPRNVGARRPWKADVELLA
eukprot:COSAG05_NODE_13504_length_427_cov_1.073171_1_plen_90_part_01